MFTPYTSDFQPKADCIHTNEVLQDVASLTKHTHIT